MGHTFTNHLYHIAFSTKERRHLIAPKIKAELYKYMCGIARNHRGQILRINGIEDHVHLLAKIQPSISISDFVRLIKANSSKWVSEKFPAVSHFVWQDGYSSFTVSESNFAKVANYIAQQEEHHKKLSFNEELEKLLEKHGFEINKDPHLE